MAPVVNHEMGNLGLLSTPRCTFVEQSAMVPPFWVEGRPRIMAPWALNVRGGGTFKQLAQSLLEGPDIMISGYQGGRCIDA